MKKTENLPLILGAAAAALVLLLAAVIPALFVRTDGAGEDAPPLTTAQRAALFQLYWSESPECAVLEAEKSAFTEEELAPSGALIGALHEAMFLDRGEPTPESTGERFYVLRTADGESLRMREYYEQSSGDWSNWFRVYVDIDTQEIYFFYQSCKCLTDASLYPPETVVRDAGTMAASWCGVIGYDNYICLRYAGNKVSAAYIRGDDAVYYDTSYTTYTSPEYVIDFRIVMQPPPSETEAQG